jgi:hypothetical protein
VSTPAGSSSPPRISPRRSGAARRALGRASPSAASRSPAGPSSEHTNRSSRISGLGACRRYAALNQSRSEEREKREREEINEWVRTDGDREREEKVGWTERVIALTDRELLGVRASGKSSLRLGQHVPCGLLGHEPSAHVGYCNF